MTAMDANSPAWRARMRRLMEDEQDAVTALIVIFGIVVTFPWWGSFLNLR